MIKCGSGRNTKCRYSWHNWCWCRFCSTPDDIVFRLNLSFK